MRGEVGLLTTGIRSSFASEARHIRAFTSVPEAIYSASVDECVTVFFVSSNMQLVALKREPKVQLSIVVCPYLRRSLNWFSMFI